MHIGETGGPGSGDAEVVHGRVLGCSGVRIEGRRRLRARARGRHWLVVGAINRPIAAYAVE